MTRAAIWSVAVRRGGERRTNDWYLAHRPEVLATAREKGLARAFSTTDGTERSSGFDAEMARYADDPFRGAQVRWLLAPGETALGLEEEVARAAIALAGLDARDVDAILCASWLPERFVAPGDAVLLARALGVTAPAYNVESACSSGTACLQLAQALVVAGTFRRVLVVLSSTNSRHTDPAGTLGWISSDAAAAWVVGPARDDREGLLGSYAENTAETCGVFEHALQVGADGRPCVRMAVGPAGGRPLREASSPALVRRLCAAALERAGVAPEQVVYWGFSTPLAWFARLCVRALEIDPARTIDLFPRYANLGAPFPAFLLHHGLAEGKVRAGDLVVLFTMGSVSSSGATVLRAGPIAHTA